MSSIPAAIRIYEAWSFGSGQSSSGTFQLVNYVTGRCLDLQNGDTSDGVTMQAWDCNVYTSNQRWYEQ